MLPVSPSHAAMSANPALASSAPRNHGRFDEPSHLANRISPRQVQLASQGSLSLTSAQRRVAEVGQQIMGQQPAPAGCACMRHWSEGAVWAIGGLGVALCAMGVFGGPTVYYIAGGIDLAAAVPLFPIVRRYGTIRQQVGMLEDVIKRQKQMLDSVQEQLRNLNAEVAEFAENESEISEHVEVLSDGIQNLRDAARTLGERIAASRAQRDELGQQAGVQAEQIRLLNQTLSQRNEELRALQETVSRISQRPEALLRAIDARSHALRMLGDQIEQVRPVLEGERGLLAAFEGAASEQAHVVGVERELRALGQLLDHFSQSLTQTAQSQSQQLIRMQEHREALETGLPNLQGDLDALELRLQELRASVLSEHIVESSATEGSAAENRDSAGNLGSESLAD